MAAGGGKISPAGRRFQPHMLRCGAVLTGNPGRVKSLAGKLGARMYRLLIALAIWLAALGAFEGQAAAAPPPLAAYGGLPGVEELQLSPSGERYALVALVAGKRQLVVVEAGKALVTLDTGDVKVRELMWAGDNFVLVVTTKTYGVDRQAFTRGRLEVAQVLVVNVAKHRAKAVFDHSDQKNGVWGYYRARQRDGRWYGYFGGLTVTGGGTGYLVSGHPDLFEVDLETGSGRQVAPRADDGHHRGWLVGPDGAVVATQDYSERSGDWKLYAGKSDGDQIAQSREPLDGAYIVGPGRTPGTLVYATSRDDGGESWFELPERGGQAQPLFAGEDPARAYFDPRTGLMNGVRMEGAQAPRMFDAAHAARLRGTLKAFPDLWVNLVSWNADFTRLIVFTSGGADSGTYWLVDITTGKADVLGRAYPGVRDAEVGPVRMVDYKAADGLALRGVLTLPAGREARNLPLVVMPHGGPWTHDDPVFDWWAQAFASRGYAVFQPNFRGSTGGGGALYQAGLGQWGRKMQTDISDGVAELARQGIVDARRACIVGGSYGGYAALAGVTLQHGLYRCAVSYAGVADMGALQIYQTDTGDDHTGSSSRFWRRYIGTGATLDDISPKAHAAQADAPILMIHGKDDTVVLYAQSQSMEAALKRAGKPVDFVTLDGEDHWLSSEATRQALLAASVAFVIKNNPPD
ncbi:MAG: peptidase prolyl oligopeptidase [Caulobacter sp.]|nr:peptidase prolyl oligopeptidase [Caulobacter sp.]